jgi:hypothetical protein
LDCKRPVEVGQRRVGLPQFQVEASDDVQQPRLIRALTGMAVKRGRLEVERDSAPQRCLCLAVGRAIGSRGEELCAVRRSLSGERRLRTR